MLQQSAIQPESWEAGNQAVLASAKQDKVESGATVRIDSTVTAALIYRPSDGALSWDGGRVMTTGHQQIQQGHLAHRCRARPPQLLRGDAIRTVYSGLIVEEEGTASSFRALAEVIDRRGLFCEPLFVGRALA